MALLRNEDFELYFSGDRKSHERAALALIRKQSFNSYNRLHSIAEDIEFVQSVKKIYSEYPFLANLRCGAWYCESQQSIGTAAHFKSSDGHYNSWTFNLRRPNLHILPFIHKHQGIILVDTTRSGKRLPDSLSKTVPIWCAVINRTLILRNPLVKHKWDTQLYTPPQGVSRQEHDQIDNRIATWADVLAKSSYELCMLDKPLRPIWITQSTSAYPHFDKDSSFFPIICVSASKVVHDGLERREKGYTYVQGAGDDHEYWSAGLTPGMFWSNKDEILSASEPELPDVLERILKSSQVSRVNCAKQPCPIQHVKGLIALSAISDKPHHVLVERGPEPAVDVLKFPCILLCNTDKTHEQDSTHGPTTTSDDCSHILKVAIPKDKKGAERAFKSCLPECVQFIAEHVLAERSVIIACENGTDLGVGVALVALQSLFLDNGSFDLRQREKNANKQTLKTRLHWIIASIPDANPSRATLKRVNEFFMSAPFT